MNESWQFDVTDIKQYACCPRLVYYRYCIPDVRPLTYMMEVGTQGHQQEDERENRRSLKHYGVEQGERLFHHQLASDSLALKGKIDLVIIVPALDAPEKEAIVVDYKYSEQKAGSHFKLQLAAYALLLEETLHIPVRRGFLYSIPLRKAEEIIIIPTLRKKVREITQEMKHILHGEQMPPATKAQQRCPTCEFRRFCNDTI
jgi:CRISPR-associated exonuclease Cas4